MSGLLKGVGYFFRGMTMLIQLDQHGHAAKKITDSLE